MIFKKFNEMTELSVSQQIRPHRAIGTLSLLTTAHLMNQIVYGLGKVSGLRGGEVAVLREG